MDPKDAMPEITPAMYGAAAYVLMAFLHWASGKGLPLLTSMATGLKDWWNGNKKEIRDDAKDGPEREVKLLRESLEETKVTLKGVIVELSTLRQQHHNCEVNQARQELKIEMQDKKIVEQAGVISAQQEEITELREQIRMQVGEWKKTQVAVQAVQAQQEQQGQ